MHKVFFGIGFKYFQDRSAVIFVDELDGWLTDRHIAEGEFSVFVGFGGINFTSDRWFELNFNFFNIRFGLEIY